MKYTQIAPILLSILTCRLLHQCFAEEMPSYDICFDQYAQRNANASAKYRERYIECEETGNKTRSQLFHAKQPEREQIEASAAEICANMEHCNALKNDLEFYECHAEKGPSNIGTIMSIKLNSMLALIDLEEQYEEAEKAALKCIIEAQREYSQDTAAAFTDLTLCLNS